MKRSAVQHGSMLVLAMLAASVCVEGQTPQYDAFTAGSVSGIIRDADGIPQMGALVQAFLPDSTPFASAITDARGRYHFALQPGSYRIRATAALLLPAFREHLQIRRGTRAVADFTLATLLAPTGWLPVSRRSAAEPSDDWMWTLRSSASRPILRLAPDDTGEAVVVSSSRSEARRGTTAARVTVNDNEGSFGHGGQHNVLVFTRIGEDGSGSIVRADFSGSRLPFPVAPSAEITVGMERRTPMGGYMRSVLTYASHPELANAAGGGGLQAIQ